MSMVHIARLPVKNRNGEVAGELSLPIILIVAAPEEVGTSLAATGDDTHKHIITLTVGLSNGDDSCISCYTVGCGTDGGVING